MFSLLKEREIIMKTTKEKIEIMQAYERGEQIQVQHKYTNEWKDINSPEFNWVECDYRIKPKNSDKLIESEFKDGDILFVTSLNSWIFIFKENENKRYIYKYVAVPICTFDTSIYINDAKLCDKEYISEIRFATEEEKQKLFDILKENNYHWDAKTKTLEKTKFDITTLKPFDKVLMRSSNAREWDATLFSHYSNDKFYGCGMCCDQCIPYEGNEHLLGTTNDCDDFYINW